MAMRVGLQLYSVRKELEKDFKGTLEKVKEIGYEGVELCGLKEGDDPQEIKDIIQNCGLELFSTNFILPQNEADWEKTLESYKILGCKYIVVPWIFRGDNFEPKEFDALMERVKTFGRLAKKHGFVMLYHNHEHEFGLVDNECMIDRMYRMVEEEYLQSEFDTCWISMGGQDPAEYLRKYAGRTPIVHLKDYTGGVKKLWGFKENNFRLPPLGQGVLNMKEIIDAAENSGAEWIVVEQDLSYETPILEDLKTSREYLHSLGY